MKTEYLLKKDGNRNNLLVKTSEELGRVLRNETEIFDDDTIEIKMPEVPPQAADSEVKSVLARSRSGSGAPATFAEIIVPPNSTCHIDGTVFFVIDAALIHTVDTNNMIKPALDSIYWWNDPNFWDTTQSSNFNNKYLVWHSSTLSNMVSYNSAVPDQSAGGALTDLSLFKNMIPNPIIFSVKFTSQIATRSAKRDFYYRIHIERRYNHLVEPYGMFFYTIKPWTIW